MTLIQYLQDPFIKIILSNKKDKSYAYNKVVVEPIQLKNKDAWQLSRYTDKQAFQENITSINTLTKRVEELFQNQYKQLNILGVKDDIEIRQSKRGKLLESHHKHAEQLSAHKTHNRSKNYLIPENQKIPALIDMGVMTKDGKIIHAQMDKFRQINKFLEIIDDTLKKWPKKEITVVDFGCGKSYLTFLHWEYS